MPKLKMIEEMETEASGEEDGTSNARLSRREMTSGKSKHKQWLRVVRKGLSFDYWLDAGKSQSIDREKAILLLADEAAY